ncbi:MAG: 23S rRNA (uracil(1939)-C(5))-methyltransferase RlmD [Elusimicrobiota bacterium]|nr:23S rRNA (uracil(1939)-C(5))-methyltransferase RlmD [Elusimicrobiota bacterium]
MSVTSSSRPEPSVAPRCRHFGTCGGCAHQDLPYEVQLAHKKEAVSKALSGLSGLPPLSILGAPEAWNYRNKMEFSFGDVYPPVEGQWLKLGMKPKGRWHTILDLEECHLPSPEAAGLLKAVREWAQKEKVPPYNSHKKEGVLRHLVIREAKNTSERMVVLMCNAGAVPEDSFVAAVLSCYPATTILVGRHEAVSDTSSIDSIEVLHGPGFVTETLRFDDGKVDYRVSPGSFFQTNSRGTEVLYSLLRSWARELGGGLALDLYCGGGGIALALAGACRKVVGVEAVESAVRDAEANARLNGIANCDFYHAKTEFLLPALLDMAPDFAVVDPPRAGLHKDAVKALLAHSPAALLYVSCNPEALARDLKPLSERYAVERLTAVDLFPHTDHVETVALLRRR